MEDKFLSTMEKAFNLVEPIWLILGALVAIFLIVFVGFVMTIVTAHKILNEGSQVHVIRSHSRRNMIFLIAFTFCIFAVLTIFYMYPGTVSSPSRTAVIYLILPALVLLWAFLCEAVFECIDNRNRKKSGMQLCYCICDDCQVESKKETKQEKYDEAAALKEEKKKSKAEAKVIAEEPKKENKIEANTKKYGAEEDVARENKQEAKESKEDRKQAEMKLRAEEIKRAEIVKQLAQTGKTERDRAEAERWREEIREVKAMTDAESDEFRRRKFEEERKQLAILAREAKAAQFGSDNSVQNEKPLPKPASVAPIAKPVPVTKPAPVEIVKPVSISPVAEKSALVKTSGDIGEPKERRETVTTTTTTSRISTVAATNNAQSKVSSKFDSLQAKLDLLKKDTAAANTATATSESRNKYNEGEVKSALNDLIKSMNARRNGGEQ